MRLNKFIALNSSYSRRAADSLIEEGRVTINGKTASQGQPVGDNDVVSIDGKSLGNIGKELTTIQINKPAGYVCSRNGQGNHTVYELIPKEWQHLNTVGRLDKESTGLLLLTNDGNLANELTHPKYQKTKLYEIELDKPLQPLHQQMIGDYGVNLEDGPSHFEIEKINDNSKTLRVTLKEGRNRQIRRTFSALGYGVIKLHRTHFGNYSLGDLKPGQITQIN